MGALAFATKKNAYVTLLLLVITLMLVAIAFGFRRWRDATGRVLVEQWRGLVTAPAWFALCAIALYTAFFQVAVVQLPRRHGTSSLPGMRFVNFGARAALELLRFRVGFGSRKPASAPAPRSPG